MRGLNLYQSLNELITSQVGNKGNSSAYTLPLNYSL